MSDISTSPSSSKKFTSNTPSWKEMCYSISAFSKLPTFSFRRTPTSLHWWIDCWRKKMLILNKFTPHPKIHGLWLVSESNSPRPANIILGIFQLKLTHLKNLDLELAEAWITLFQSVGKIDPSLSAGEPTSVCHWGHLHFPSHYFGGLLCHRLFSGFQGSRLFSRFQHSCLFSGFQHSRLFSNRIHACDSSYPSPTILVGVIFDGRPIYIYIIK